MLALSGIGCFLVSVLAIHFFGFKGSLASIWPANGFVLAQLLGRPRREWTGLLTTGFVAMAAAGVHERGVVVGPTLIASANIVEIALAAWMLGGSLHEGRLLHRHGSVGRFVLCAGFIAPTSGAAIAAIWAAATLQIPLLGGFFTKFAADSLGLLIFTPFFFGLFRGDTLAAWRAALPSGRVQMLLLYLMTLVVSTGVFAQDRFPLLFLPMVPLIVLAFRLGWQGTSVGVLLVAIPGVVATYKGTGPVGFTHGTMPVQIAFLQFYLATTLVLAMPVAAALQVRRDLIDQLSMSERALNLLADRSAIVLLRFGLEGSCTRVVGDTANLLGHRADSLLGTALAQFDQSLSAGLLAAHGSALAEATPVTCEIEVAPGCWVEATFRVEHDEGGTITGTVATLSDVTARKAREGELSLRAETDPLTGLANRAGFKHRFELALVGDPDLLSVALIDIDRFKSLNDELGHLVGDAVLAEIGRRIVTSVRSTDLVARLGGDEFVVLLEGTDADGARATCARIVASVAGVPVGLAQGGEVETQISCGLAHARASETGISLLERADKALYRAKRAGRNQLVAA